MLLTLGRLRHIISTWTEQDISTPPSPCPINMMDPNSPITTFVTIKKLAEDILQRLDSLSFTDNAYRVKRYIKCFRYSLL
jgi:hypothetical protein